MNQEVGKNAARWIAALRVALGWLMFYAGITKLIDPTWSAAEYLTHAQTFAGFYNWLAQPGILGAVNFLNEWGLTLLGVSLIVGVGVRVSASLGAILMLLYYFPAVNFPFVANGFLVDEHIVYATALVLLAAVRAGRYYGLETRCANLPICSRYPRLRSFFG